VPSGVDFDGRDWRTVNLIIFVIGPEGNSNKYDMLFSAISRALHSPGVIEEMLAESTPEALRESFLLNVRGKKHWAMICFVVIALFYALYEIGFFQVVRSII
ncbi:MAG: PTS sugar transporter subunit IIA, partial [bacterium]